MIPFNLLSVVVFILTVFIAADFALSFRAALDIRDILLAMEKVKEEMAHMQKRLDVIAAVTGEEIGQYRSAAEMRIEELVTDIEDRLHRMKEWAGLHLSIENSAGTLEAWYDPWQSNYEGIKESKIQPGGVEGSSKGKIKFKFYK